MESKELAILCKELAENRKAENVVVLDVSKVSSVTDYFVVASGSSDPHLRAISSEITDELRDKHQLRARAVDGEIHAAWQVLDYFDVIVHVMRADVREKYNLEGLWGDAPRIGADGQPMRRKAKKTKVVAKAVSTGRKRKTIKIPRKSSSGTGRDL
ncbi:MAG: iojap-like protein [Verrucomicrobiales bacterium]|nr:iojap-like protein [Verrucomicrobiales bacterium]